MILPLSIKGKSKSTTFRQNEPPSVSTLFSSSSASPSASSPSDPRSRHRSASVSQREGDLLEEAEEGSPVARSQGKGSRVLPQLRGQRSVSVYHDNSELDLSSFAEVQARRSSESLDSGERVTTLERSPARRKGSVVKDDKEKGWEAAVRVNKGLGANEAEGALKRSKVEGSMESLDGAVIRKKAKEEEDKEKDKEKEVRKEGKLIKKKTFVLKKEKTEVSLAGEGEKRVEPNPRKRQSNAELDGGAEERKKQKAQHVMRKRIFDELLATEQSYVNNLEILQTYFITPLENTKALSQEEIYSLVANWQELAVLQTSFLGQLRERAKDWTEFTPIWDIFEEFAGKLEVYRPYMTSYNRCALSLLYMSRKNLPLVQVLRSFEDHMKRTTRLPIESVFIMPIQRIPRYVLLLRELKKYTNEQHPDFEGIPKTVLQIESKMGDLNKGIRKGEQEELKAIQTIFESVEGEIHNCISPSSHYLREGQLKLKKVTAAKGDKSPLSLLKPKADYLCYLFQETLLICRPNKANDLLPYKLEHFMLLEDCMQMDVENAAKGKPAFLLVLKNGSKLLLRASTYEETLGWIADIEKSLKGKRT